MLEPLEQQLKQHRPQLVLQLERSHRFNDSTALGGFVQKLRRGSPAAELQQQLVGWKVTKKDGHIDHFLDNRKCQQSLNVEGSH